MRICVNLVDDTEKYCATIGRNAWLLKNLEDKADAEIFIVFGNILSALHSHFLENNTYHV